MKSIMTVSTERTPKRFTKIQPVEEKRTRMNKTKRRKECSWPKGWRWPTAVAFLYNQRRKERRLEARDEAEEGVKITAGGNSRIRPIENKVGITRDWVRRLPVFNMMTTEDLAKYSAMYTKSDGFDIDFDAIPRARTDFRAVKSRSPSDKRVVRSAKMAIAKYNKDKTLDYEFLMALRANANLTSSITYRVTFMAKPKNSDQSKARTFQASVSWSVTKTIVDFCRLAPQQ